MDVVFGHFQGHPKGLPGLRIYEAETPVPVVCRCGTRVPAGGKVILLSQLPDPLAGLFKDRSFDSIRCLRAFCLESMELLDGLDTPAANDTVTDLHELYQEMARAFAQILSGA